MKMTKLEEMEGMWETWQKSTLRFYKEAPGRNGCLPHAIFVIEISGECRENWGENHYSPQRICSACKIYFIWPEKTWLLWASLYGHAFSYWQSLKITKSEDAHANEGRQKRTKQTTNIVTQRLFCICVGYELIRGEAAISLRRWRRG